MAMEKTNGKEKIRKERYRKRRVKEGGNMSEKSEK